MTRLFVLTVVCAIYVLTAQFFGLDVALLLLTPGLSFAVIVTLDCKAGFSYAIFAILSIIAFFLTGCDKNVFTYWGPQWVLIIVAYMLLSPPGGREQFD